MARIFQVIIKWFTAPQAARDRRIQGIAKNKPLFYRMTIGIGETKWAGSTMQSVA